MTTKQLWTPAEEAELKTRWEGPDSIALIAQAMGRSRDSIARHARTMKLSPKTTSNTLQRGTDWPEEVLERALELWKDGKSAGEISKTLTTKDREFTRSAVIGRLSRAGAKRSKSAAKEAFRLGGVMKAPRAVKPVSAEAPNPEPILYSSDETLPTLMALGRGCKWPIGEVAHGRDQRFCGCAKPMDKPYCADHAVLAFQPMTGDMKAKRWERGAMRGIL